MRQHDQELRLKLKYDYGAWANQILNGKYDAQLATLIGDPPGAVTLIAAVKDADVMLARAA